MSALGHSQKAAVAAGRSLGVFWCYMYCDCAVGFRERGELVLCLSDNITLLTFAFNDKHVHLLNCFVYRIDLKGLSQVECE